MIDSKDKIAKVISALVKMADNGLHIINSREDMSVKKRMFRGTWFRLISQNPKVKPEVIGERYLEFSDFFRERETKEIIDVIEIVGEVIDEQADDIRKKSEKVLRIIDSRAIEPTQKKELITKCMKSIKERVKGIESFFGELIDCIICGRDFLNFRPISLNRLLNTAVQITSHCREACKISLLEKISEDIPPLNIDSEKILEVIVGLLSTLIEAIPIKGKLLIDAAPVEKKLIIQVAGNNANLKKDFEPFHFKEDEIIFNGSLYSYKRIIEAHGGTIDFESQPEYSIFTIKLPMG